MSNTKITIGVCGTTQRTVRCLEAIQASEQFQILWVITPPPKPVGRKKELTPSPVETWAHSQGIEVRHVSKKLSEIQTIVMETNQKQPIDFLFVVDFGYMIPQWLLDLPSIAPINVHPSDLPRWRGSSPGQCVLLSGETESAVCIMRLIWEMDAGPVIARLPLPVPANMTQNEYYQQAFDLAHDNIVPVLLKYAQDRRETEQPTETPTPIAARFDRNDGYLPYEVLKAAQLGQEITLERSGITDTIQGIIQAGAQSTHLSATKLIDRMVRALSPWPGVWTMVPEYKGRENVRLKILAGRVENSGAQEKYTVQNWQYDGEPAKTGIF